MTVHFFTKGDRNFASSRVRVFIVADWLRQEGIDSQVHTLSSFPWWRLSYKRFAEGRDNLRTLRSMHSDDILYLHKTVMQVDFVLLVLLAIFFLKRKYIFDFDDAIYLYAGWKMRMLVTNASHVIVGGHELETYARRHNARVSLIPTSIDIMHYVPRESAAPSIVKVIGWIGNPDPQSLALLVDPLKALVSEGLSFTLRLVGVSGNTKIHEMFGAIPGLDLDIVESIDWTKTQNNVECIQDFMIGVAPLGDSKWNQGKCAFKAIEYMGCAVPVVASHVGEFPYLITDGQNGYLASSEDEWKHRLRQLLKDDALARRIGLSGRETVIKRYSYQVNIARISNIIWNL